MDAACGRIIPSIPADRQLTIKPRLPDYLLKLSFDSVVSGDQEYGYPLLPALSGGILKTFAGIFGSECSRTLVVALLED